MTPDEAPVGTVCVVGHPDNGVTATKHPDGTWRYNSSARNAFGEPVEVDYDTRHKAMSAVYIPGRHG